MTITIDGLNTPQLAKTLGASVQLDTDVAGDFYQWELLDKPEGSAAALSSSATKNPTITPDITGTYLLKLLINGSNAYFGALAVPSVRANKRFIAFGEGDAAKGGNVAGDRGWAESLNQTLRGLEAVYGKGSVELCYNNTGSEIAAKKLTYIADVYTKASGMSEEQAIPSIALADATDEVKTRSLGFTLEAIAHGSLGLVLREGMMPKLDTSAFAAVGDAAYLSDTPGAFAIAKGTKEQRIGYVVKKHASEGAIYIDPGGNAGVTIWEPFSSAYLIDDTEVFVYGQLNAMTATYSAFASETQDVFAFDTEDQP